jgi:hypothetical protein
MPRARRGTTASRAGQEEVRRNRRVPTGWRLTRLSTLRAGRRHACNSRCQSHRVQPQEPASSAARHSRKLQAGCLTIVAGVVYSTERRSTVPTGVFSARPALQIIARLAVFIRLNPKPIALSSTDSCFVVHCGVRDPRNSRICPDRRPADLPRCEPGGPVWSDVGLLRTGCLLPVARDSCLLGRPFGLRAAFTAWRAPSTKNRVSEPTSGFWPSHLRGI